MNQKDDFLPPSHSKDNKNLVLKPPKNKLKELTRMPFGRFKGLSINYVIEKERWYIDWLLQLDDLNENLRHTIISKL